MELAEFFDMIAERKITRSVLTSLFIEGGAGCGEILQAMQAATWCEDMQVRTENEIPSNNFCGQALCGITRHFLAVGYRDLEVAREAARKNPDLGWQARAWLLIYQVTGENKDLQEANTTQSLFEAQSSSPDILYGLEKLRCGIP